MKRSYFFIVVILFLMVSCRTEPLLHPLYIVNNSNDTLKIYFNDDKDHRSVYPDTLITNFENRIIFEDYPPLSGKLEITAVGSWKKSFKIHTIQDTMSIFVFHSDTLARYSWREIRRDYKVLARYDLSLEDLERLDFELSYPPDSRMQGIKMYPR